MDALFAQDERRRSGRRSRGVLISRRWYQPGDDACASHRGWWQESPITRETTKETVKPSRRECRTVRRTCGDYARTLFYLRTRLRVRRAPGIPCALVFEGFDFARLGRVRVAGRVKLCMYLDRSFRGAPWREPGIYFSSYSYGIMDSGSGPQRKIEIQFCRFGPSRNDEEERSDAHRHTVEPVFPLGLGMT